MNRLLTNKIFLSKLYISTFKDNLKSIQLEFANGLLSERLGVETTFAQEIDVINESKQIRKISIKQRNQPKVLGLKLCSDTNEELMYAHWSIGNNEEWLETDIPEDHYIIGMYVRVSNKTFIDRIGIVVWKPNFYTI